MAALLRPGVFRACRNLTVFATKNSLSYVRLSQKSLSPSVHQNLLPNLSAVRYFTDNSTPESTSESVENEIHETEGSTTTEFNRDAGAVAENTETRPQRTRDRGKIGRNQYERLVQKLGVITTRPSLMKIFEEMLEREEAINHLQAYQLLRNCGKELIYETPEKRLELAHYFWDKLQAAGVPLDVMMYNALLSVYLQNDYKFNPLEVLEQIQTSGLEPNLTTMALVIQGFGQNGDIPGVFKVLEFMKAADMPVTEPVYTSLIIAYGKTGDMESAKGVFNMMRENGLEPKIDSYTALLTMHAENGDLVAIDETITEMQESRVYPTPAMYLSLIDTFSKCGRDDIIRQIIEKPAVNRLIGSDLQSLMLMLAGRGEVKAAFAILDHVPQQHIVSLATNPQYVLLRQIIMSRQSTETIVMAVNELNTRGVLKDVYETALDLSFSLRRPETSIAIIKEMLAKKVKVKKHYFYPMLACYANDVNAKGSQEIFNLMAEHGVDIDPISLSYCIKSFGQPKDADIDVFLNVSKDVTLSPFLLKTIAALVMETGNMEKLSKILDYDIDKDGPERTFQKAFGIAMKKSFDAENCIQILKEMKSRDITKLIALDICDGLETCCKSHAGCKQGVKFLKLILTEGLQDLIDSRSYTSVMKFMNVHNLEDDFLELIGTMKKHQVPLDEHQYRQMIRMFSFVGETKAAQFCYDNYQKLVDPDRTVYSLLISSYGHSKDGGYFAKGMRLKYKNPRKIVELYEEMQTKELTPDNRALSYILMSYLTLGKIPEADAVKELFGTLGALTYRVQTQYLMAYASKGEVENVERVMEEMRSMENVHMSTYPYNLAMGAYKLHGDVETQRKLLKEMETSGVRVNGATYSEIMKTYLYKDDAEGALSILEEAKSNNSYPTLSACIYLLNVCAKNLSPERMEQVAMEMHQDVIEGRTNTTAMVLSHAIIYTCISNDRSDLARRIVNEIPNHNPQQYSFNASSDARRGESESILKCIQFLGENNMDSTSLLIPLCRSYESAHDPQSALAAYNKFIQDGGEPWKELQIVLAGILRKHGEPLPFSLPEGNRGRNRRFKRGPDDVTNDNVVEESELEDAPDTSEGYKGRGI